jgi:hypothetical protein
MPMCATLRMSCSPSIPGQDGHVRLAAPDCDLGQGQVTRAPGVKTYFRTSPARTSTPLRPIRIHPPFTAPPAPLSHRRAPTVRQASFKGKQGESKSAHTAAVDQHRPRAVRPDLPFPVRGRLFPPGNQHLLQPVRRRCHRHRSAAATRGELKQFLTVPTGAETCGPLVQDRRVLVAVQHPGEINGATVEKPASTWPDGPGKIVRPRRSSMPRGSTSGTATTSAACRRAWSTARAVSVTGTGRLSPVGPVDPHPVGVRGVADDSGQGAHGGEGAVRRPVDREADRQGQGHRDGGAGHGGPVDG